MLSLALAFSASLSSPSFMGSEVTGFSDARAWTLGYGDKPRIPLVADLAGTGRSAVVSVNPDGEGYIDVDLGQSDLKASGGFQALANFGKNCQAATAGKLPGAKQASVFGLFNGVSIGCAHDLKDNHLQNTPDWVKLPTTLKTPELALLDQGATLLAYSADSGTAFAIDTASKAVKPMSVPNNLIFLGDEGDDLVGQFKDGTVSWLDRKTFHVKSRLGNESKGYLPAVGPGIVVVANFVWTPGGTFQLSKEPYAEAPTIFGLGNLDATNRPVLFEFKQSNTYHKGGLILKRRARLKSDSLRDVAYESSESYWRDSGNDGLLDGWKMAGFRGLDLKGMGCTPNHADVICLISLFDDVDRKFVDSDMKRIVKFYADLKVPNADGTTGIRFHPIFLDPIKGADKNNPWWVNQDKFLPAKWKGVVHWMQITNGGGGQANELADGGTCGTGALWAVFVHEFGHQLGLNHEGFLSVGASPMYTSLMNYTWSYGFEESRDKIHYSDGTFTNFAVQEDDLDEVLPFPIEKVKFLSMAPYHFHMKANGSTTLIDWNWNGILGEKHVKANINYAYSISAGERDNLGKTKSAPWLFTHQNRLFALYGTNDLPVDLKVQPTITPSRPGRLLLKRMQKPRAWDPEWIIESGGLLGDPVATSFGKKIVCAYPTAQGLQMRQIEITKDGPITTVPQTFNSDSTLVPTIGVYNNRCYLFDWNPKTQEVGYRTLTTDGKLNERIKLDVLSSNPVGICVDPYAKEAVLGLAQDQPKGRTHRWQIRRYRSDDKGALLADGAPDWVEGVDGGARGNDRVTVLFDSSRDAGPKGRVYFYCKGLTDEKSPWTCAYVALQIADKTYHGGWIVKRYYDEWSTTRSAPAATWWDGDIVYAYRWTAGDQSETDNNFHLGYHGLGIEPGAMGDFNDLAYIRDFGLANSILNLVANP
jgi:hypothetical protein